MPATPTKAEDARGVILFLRAFAPLFHVCENIQDKRFIIEP